MTNKTAYDAYGALAQEVSEQLLVSGRHTFQAEHVAGIVADIANKLDLKPTDTLLEIGCNVGLLLNPLAKQVLSAFGQDHPNLIAAWQKDTKAVNISLIGGSWPETQPEGLFDKILCYSVLLTLADAGAINYFIDQALLKLKPDGLALFGDFSNEDKRLRYFNSPQGADMAKFYEDKRQVTRLKSSVDYARRDEIFKTAETPLRIDDKFLLGLVARLRGAGFEAYLVNQPVNLPFAETRDDLLVRRRS